MSRSSPSQEGRRLPARRPLRLRGKHAPSDTAPSSDEHAAPRLGQKPLSAKKVQSAYATGLSRQEAMSVWEVVVALMPTMLIVAAGTVLIEHLRVKSEGDRYQYGEYRADEELSHDHGMNGNGQSQKPKSRRAHTRWKDWLP